MLKNYRIIFDSNPVDFDGIKTRILALAEEQEVGR